MRVFIQSVIFIIAFSSSSYASVIVTLPPLAGLVSMLDAESDVRCLFAMGQDPHNAHISPKQKGMLLQSDLVVRASADDRHWLALRRDKVAVFDLWPKHAHAWLQPSQVRKVLPKLADVLITTYPKREKVIRKNLQEAFASLDVIELAWKEALAPFQPHGVILQHTAWRHLLQQYGVAIVASLDTDHHGHEISPRRLERALAAAVSDQKITLWGDQYHDNRAVEWLQEHGAKGALFKLDPLGYCGAPWTDLMRENIAKLTVLTP
ncbi:MAG: metal ABC transporter substrate-binding protein [Mariprofundaceae bacterium]